MFWLHVKKRTKMHVFSLWRGVTLAPNRQTKLGLASGWGQEAPFDFSGVYGDVEKSHGDTKVLLPAEGEFRRFLLFCAKQRRRIVFCASARQREKQCWELLVQKPVFCAAKPRFLCSPRGD